MSTQSTISLTPEQAWNLLFNVTGTLALNRTDHNAVIQALAMLKPANIAAVAAVGE